MPKKNLTPTPSQKLASKQKLAKDLQTKGKQKQKTAFEYAMEDAINYRHAGYALWSGKPKVKIADRNELVPLKVFKNGKGEAEGIAAINYTTYGSFAVNKFEGDFNLVYYPKVRDIEIFRKASGGLRRGAPGQRFLGSVGSMRVSVMEENKKPSYEVHYIQAHAKSGTKRSPPRALLTKYGGWRQKLLEVVFNEAKKNGGLVHITTKNPDLNPVEALKLQTRLDIFKEVAKKCGFTVRAEYLGNEEKFISLVASLKK